MTRTQAIALLAERDLHALKLAERARLLERMMNEAWTSDPAWPTLSQRLRAELAAGELVHGAGSPRYDEALRLPLMHQYCAVTNDFLAREVADVAGETAPIEGREPSMAACPCCGSATLDARGQYDICPVCWWEDSGQDNADADAASCPNDGMSLVRGRVNYLHHGIYNPARGDLRRHQRPASWYRLARSFRLVANRLEEPDAGWSVDVEDDEQPMSR